MASPTQAHQAPPRRWRCLRRGLAVVALGYLGILIVLLALENWYVYHPATAAESWVDATDPAVRDVYLDLPTGERVHAWWRPRADAKLAILYCHGNAGNLSHRSGSTAKFAEALDASVLIFDYPGYGRSTGRPSEPSCYAAGEAAWSWLTTEQGVRPDQVVLVGGSLGAAIATNLAAEHGCRALVLVKGFTSIPDMATSMFPWLPARYLVRHRFDNLAKLPAVRRPVFVTHGTTDGIIPFTHGERLFAAANEPKQFLPLPGNDHNDRLPDEFFTRLRQFIDTHP